jgi:hypothetical protein
VYKNPSSRIIRLVFPLQFALGQVRFAATPLFLSILQITAMELYTSAAQIPVELNTTGSACGVLVVWTRSGDTGQ